MATYSWPTNEELALVESDKLEALNAADPFEQWMPVVNADAYYLRWQVEGYAGGLQQLRGLNGDPTYVTRVGASDYLMKPGVYGEFMTVDEEEMTTRGARFFPGGGQGRIDLGDLVMRLQDQLLDRRVRLIRYIRTTLFATGTFAIADKKGTGGYRHTDSYSVQTYNASTWATVASATPIADLRAVKLLGRGKNADFGGRATALMNATTFNNLIGNTNAADLGGQKTTTLSPLVSADQFNQVMIAADLPRILVWEDGYYDASGTFHLYIPDGVVIVVSGTRGGNVGEYRMVWNAVNQGPGPYRFVNNRGQSENRVPPLIEVHDGHNGGPVMLRPWQVVVMDVS